MQHIASHLHSAFQFYQTPPWSAFPTRGASIEGRASRTQPSQWRAGEKEIIMKKLLVRVLPRLQSQRSWSWQRCWKSTGNNRTWRPDCEYEKHLVNLRKVKVYLKDHNLEEMKMSNKFHVVGKCLPQSQPMVLVSSWSPGSWTLITFAKDISQFQTYKLIRNYQSITF